MTQQEADQSGPWFPLTNQRVKKEPPAGGTIMVERKVAGETEIFPYCPTDTGT
jgi:hypothetical protein